MRPEIGKNGFVSCLLLSLACYEWAPFSIFLNCIPCFIVLHCPCTALQFSSCATFYYPSETLSVFQ